MAACRTKLSGTCEVSAIGDSDLIKPLKLELRKAQAQLAIARNEASYRYIVDGNFLPLFEENDVLTFFNMFERMCALCDAVPAIYCKLLDTRLTSKATRMVSQLSADRRHDYNAVKNAILAGYHCVSRDGRTRDITCRPSAADKVDRGIGQVKIGQASVVNTERNYQGGAVSKVSSAHGVVADGQTTTGLLDTHTSNFPDSVSKSVCEAETYADSVGGGNGDHSVLLINRDRVRDDVTVVDLFTDATIDADHGQELT